MSIYCRTKSRPSDGWWERDYQDHELRDLLRSVIERGHQVEVMINKQWTPLLEAFPGLTDEGNMLCAKCRRFYSSDECELEVIKQKWGKIEHVLCPEGHIAKSTDHFSVAVTSWLRRQQSRSLTDLARDKSERDRGPFPIGH